MKRSVNSLLFLVVFLSCSGQENAGYRNSSFSTGFSQLKEAANFGLVFTGPEISYGMTWNCRNDKRIITYRFEFGVGIPFSKNIQVIEIRHIYLNINKYLLGILLLSPH